MYKFIVKAYNIFQMWRYNRRMEKKFREYEQNS